MQEPYDGSRIEEAIKALTLLIDDRLRNIEKDMVEINMKLKNMEGYENLKMQVNTIEAKFNIIWVGLGGLGLLVVTAIVGAILNGVIK